MIVHRNHRKIVPRSTLIFYAQCWYIANTNIKIYLKFMDKWIDQLKNYQSVRSRFKPTIEFSLKSDFQNKPASWPPSHPENFQEARHSNTFKRKLLIYICWGIMKTVLNKPSPQNHPLGVKKGKIQSALQ